MRFLALFFFFIFLSCQSIEIIEPVVFDNDQFSSEKLSDEITIFDNLDFDKWIELIKASKYVITPECGILHITSLCQNHLTVIYDADYFPEMMMHEYAPWKKPYNKLIFNNLKLSKTLQLLMSTHQALRVYGFAWYSMLR